MTRGILAALLAIAVPSTGPAEPAAVPPQGDLAPIGFLVGSWSGGGVSDAGPGSGSDTFRLDVRGRVIVRRSHADYAGTAARPASTYDSLMTIYHDPAYPTLRADYVDDGGHAIHYSLVAGTAANVARFVSDPTAGAPRFRLTYTDAPDDRSMTVVFEMEPPGADAFTTTIASGTLTRTPPPSYVR